MTWRMLAASMALWAWAPICSASDFKHVGDYLLKAHYKLTGDVMTPIPMKPIAFSVSTNGISVRVSAEGDDESYSTFEIYRSDGISRQRTSGGAIEIIPGIQAISRTDGIVRHLRLCAESMTITTFPGISNQTIVSYSIAAEPVKPSREPQHGSSTPP